MEQEEICENELLPETYPALKIFVVLKNILRNLSDSQLVQTRLVNRSWNFAATSELVTRLAHAALSHVQSFHQMKAFNESDSNQSPGGSYRWFIDFENSRRLLWTNLYGVDCPIIKFHHQNFYFPEESDDFIEMLQLPWHPSITSLMLSVCESSCEKFLTTYFLPSFVNLRSLACFMEPESEFIFGDLFSELLANLSLTDDASSGSDGSASTRQGGNYAESKPCSYSTLKSVLVCFEEPCKFPWTLLDAFPELEDLELCFGDAASLVKCSEDLISETQPRKIGKVQLRIIHKPNLHSLKEQVVEPGFITRTFANANANLCNHLLAQQKLSVLTMLPASYTFSFFRKLKAMNATHFELEFATPCNDRMFLTQRAFPRLLIPEIGRKFPHLTQLQLNFLQYKSDAAFTIAGTEALANSPSNLSNLKKLQIGTQATDFEKDCFVYCTIYGAELMRTARTLQELTEVVFEVDKWYDCAAIIAALSFLRVKKLTLKMVSNVASVWLASWVFFPGDGFISNWYYGNDIGLVYTGLPGIKTIQELHLELIGVFYDPAIEREFPKVVSLKSIFLDARCNQVDDGKVSQGPLEYWDPETCYFWPSDVAGVSIVAK